MGLPNRTRDFTSSTLLDILSQLQGPTEEYWEFTRFWDEHGPAFDTLDMSANAAYIDNFVSDSRRIISAVAPAKFKEVFCAVKADDAKFAKDCEGTCAELQAYAKSLDVLIETISSSGFPANFSRIKLESALANHASAVNPEKAAFVKNMMEQFGFDKETTILMWKVKESIDKNNLNATQQERDWTFTRAISQLCYNRGEESAEQWRAGAGYVYGYSDANALKYFMDLGFSEAEYNLLRYKVRAQNQITGSPIHHSPENLDYSKTDNPTRYAEWKAAMEKALEKSLSDLEFDTLWKQQFNQFCSTSENGDFEPKGDFAHMMYTIAGCCANEKAKGIDNSYPNFPASIIAGKFWTDAEGRKKYIGWLGDATWAGINNSGVSFGPNDYLADLDSDNIRMRMESDGKSFFEASKDYYADLAADPKLRAQEFKDNNGGYNAIKETVLTAAGVETLVELRELGGREGSYNFLLSIFSGQPKMTIYIEPSK